MHYLSMQNCHASMKMATGLILSLWPWSPILALITGFTVNVVIRSVDINNTSVGHLSTEFSCLLWHFLTRGGEINAEGDGALYSFQTD